MGNHDTGLKGNAESKSIGERLEISAAGMLSVVLGDNGCVFAQVW